MRLQKSPLGLLGAFLLKTDGRNPADFGETVVPTTDVTDHYVLPQQEIARATVTITGPAVGANVGLTVPQGEIWRVWGASMFWIHAAGDAALLAAPRISMLRPTATPVLYFPLTNGLNVTGAHNRVASVLNPRPILVTAGYQLNSALTLSAAPGTPIDLEFCVLRERFPE